MKALIIPDCHLKPYMYQRAAELMRNKVADIAVSLMDIPDDWNKQFMLEEYEEAYDAVIAFAEEFPSTLFCYGNHDICYVWNERESGYSHIAPRLVCTKLEKLNSVLPKDNQIKFIQRIDNVLFCHGGLCEYFVYENILDAEWDDIDAVIDAINGMGHYDLWCDDSPIWYRPQDYEGKMFREDEFLQVVGHTPVYRPENVNNVLSCDLFSTYSDGTPIGTEEYVIVDTETWEFEAVK